MVNCNHKVAPNKEYYCILEPMHKGKHRYMINGIERTIYSGCCPEGEVVKYEGKKWLYSLTTQEKHGWGTR